MQLKDVVTSEILTEGEKVNIVGTSKGKGFQGVVKRHGFSGVGGQTHGQHNRLRAPGSLGACSTPARVMKGMKMGGRMGTDRVKEQNMKIVKVLNDENLIHVQPVRKYEYHVVRHYCLTIQLHCHQNECKYRLYV